MFNAITWIALSVSNFFNFYDNKDYYLKKEKPNYKARVEREYKKAHKSELLKENNKEKIAEHQ